MKMLVLLTDILHKNKQQYWPVYKRDFFLIINNSWDMYSEGQ